MTRKPLSHYSPVFANKRWADASGFISYFRDPHKQRVLKASTGKRQWGRKRGLYRRSIEAALSARIETEAARVYEKLCQYEEATFEDRLVWAQFLMSQLVRTPTFLRYEDASRRIPGSRIPDPNHDVLAVEIAVTLPASRRAIGAICLHTRTTSSFGPTTLCSARASSSGQNPRSTIHCRLGSALSPAPWNFAGIRNTPRPATCQEQSESSYQRAEPG